MEKIPSSMRRMGRRRANFAPSSMVCAIAFSNAIAHSEAWLDQRDLHGSASQTQVVEVDKCIKDAPG